MSRVRLTARGRSAADQTPYPGNVNQPDRKDPSWEQYHTFEQRVNHELPDMRHDWQNDGRDDIGFGIPEEWGKSPTVASVRVAANKAVRIAVLLLGDKVSDEVIEVQARDLMGMGPKAMDRTLQRFAETQKLYAAEEAEGDEKGDKDDEKKAADEPKKVEDEKKAVSEAEFKPKIEKPGSDEQPKVAEDKKDDAKKDEAKCAADDKKDDTVKASDLKALVASAVAEAMKAALPDFIQKKVDEKKDDAKDEKKESKKGADESADKKDDKACKAADDKKDDAKADEKKAADESDKKDDAKDEKKAADESKKDDEAEKKASAEPRKAMGEFDIELTGAMEDEPAADPEADERLASLFDDPMAVAAAGNSGRKAEASQKKAGITKLGGQPRVASAEGAGVDISSIWQSAPDVSEAFK